MLVKPNPLIRCKRWVCSPLSDEPRNLCEELEYARRQRQLNFAFGTITAVLITAMVVLALLGGVP